MSLQLGVIADDLTGGMETAAMLVAEGVDCAFVTKPDGVASIGDAQAVVVAQKTRVIDPAEAVRLSEEAARTLMAAGARQLFFKYCGTFDSTDDGNIGPVADRLLELTGAAQTAFCPTSVEMERSVFNGHLFVGRQLVSNSPKRHDPLTPMNDPDLVAVLARQSKFQVGLVWYSAIRSGGPRLHKAIEDLVSAGVRHIIVDAVYEEDLAAIAELTESWTLMTGNAAVVRHYPAVWRARNRIGGRAEAKVVPAAAGAGAVLAGSCAGRTLEQLDAFEAHRPVNRIKLSDVENPEQTISDALAWAERHLADGPVAISTSALPEAVNAAQQRFGREGAAALAERILGEISVGLHRIGVRRFVVAGGETSGAVVESLGVRSLRIGPYREAGIARAATDGHDVTALSLKSGKLGPVDMFLPMLDSMLRPEQTEKRS